MKAGIKYEYICQIYLKSGLLGPNSDYCLVSVIVHPEGFIVYGPIFCSCHVFLGEVVVRKELFSSVDEH